MNDALDADATRVQSEWRVTATAATKETDR